MKENLIKKWSAFWCLTKDAEKLNEAFRKELEEVIAEEVKNKSVNGCYSIDNRKPRPNQPILYEGNHGLTEGTYRNFADGVGWVLLPNGGVDCFDKWKPNDR